MADGGVAVVRRTDLVLLHRGGTSSSDKGVAYAVVLRNTGGGTFWDVDIRLTHDGEETDRKTVHRVEPQSESGQLFLLVPARLCDEGTPGVGLRPLGHVAFEALIDDEVVATGHPLEQAPEPESERVPRTPEEEAVLVRTRPPGWEYLLFASVLLRRMNALEPKYRDHQLRLARTELGSKFRGSEAMARLSSGFGESRVLLDNFNRVFDQAAQVRAFGVPGEPGDPVQIEHLGSRLIDVYEGLLDWAARTRGALVDDEFKRAVELSSRFVDLPIEQFRDFVDHVVTETDRIPAILRAESEKPVALDFTITLSIEDGLEEELAIELRRLEEIYERGELYD